MYDHTKSEKEILAFWSSEKILEKINKKNESNETFYFCDGPPYATGQIHPGTGWNKTLKDAVCRYKRFIGKNVRVQAGYDTHGLPIEVKVEQELKFGNKNDIEKYGIAKFIAKCRAFATKYIEVMGSQFESLGVWMNFSNPYVTYKDEYISASWKTLKMANEKGLLHEGIYVLPYCYRCETTIANYELEYADETDPSIFVKFKLKDKNEYLLIWTTTPWTLVANMAVMAHPTFQYVKAEIDGEILILAKDRLEAFLSASGKSATILEEFTGRKLKDLYYEHPFQNQIFKYADRRVVLSDEYVTLEDGSGLVHMAPGHGPADFLVGKRNDIEAFCPVDAQGKYTSDSGSIFEGKHVRESNSIVTEILEQTNSLVHASRIKHRYPHCWRCKTPLIFITTKQWFITISKIKDQMIEEINKTNWHPEFAKDRFREFVLGAPDWCISRQRYWGIPLPIWKCDCGSIKVIGSKDEIPQIKELHRPYIDEVQLDCSNCSKKMKRIPDVLDVWFDSGNAVWAPLDQSEKNTYGDRADLIIEGQDQIRGWFYSLLGSGVVRYGSCPYKSILMHGFFVDEKGEKMSKSVGNFVPLEQILERMGADSFRLWGASSTTWEELKFSWDEMKKCKSDLNILYNLVSFLEKSYVKLPTNPKLTPLDNWMLSRLHSTLKTFHESFEHLEINTAAKAVRNLIVEDLSRFYMKIAKERISSMDNNEGAVFVLYKVLFASLKMLGCFCPLISEHLYQKFFRQFEKTESLFLCNLEVANVQLLNAVSESQMEIVKEMISSILLARQTAQIKLRWPIKTVYVETSSHNSVDAASINRDTILSMVNSKEIHISDKSPTSEVVSETFSLGKIHIDKKLDESLYEEGMLNEVKRRIQMMRKELALVETDPISVSIVLEKELEVIIKKHEKSLENFVNAKSILFSASAKMTDYEIDGRLIRIGVEKV